MNRSRSLRVLSKTRKAVAFTSSSWTPTSNGSLSSGYETKSGRRLVKPSHIRCDAEPSAMIQIKFVDLSIEALNPPKKVRLQNHDIFLSRENDVVKLHEPL